MRGKFLFYLVLASAFVLFGLVGARQLKYAGVTVDFVTFTGPQIAEPLQRHAPQFEALTG
ncbi:MAG: hypothetical protein HY335_01825, partial [Deinococcus sp.]|nr:hypothetical protein [Deinococcus sp.]